jgi:hypothetical protein
MWFSCWRQVIGIDILGFNMYFTWLNFCSAFSRVVDVGSEWRTFSNEAGNADPSRVGGAENTLLNGTNLTTIIGPSTSGGGTSFNETGGAVYKNRQTVISFAKVLFVKSIILNLTSSIVLLSR